MGRVGGWVEVGREGKWKELKGEGIGKRVLVTAILWVKVYALDDRDER